jgi:hypothetical protein
MAPRKQVTRIIDVPSMLFNPCAGTDAFRPGQANPVPSQGSIDATISS